MNFDSVIGQAGIISCLTNALRKNNVGHAYMFTGLKGVGKKTVAGIFAGLLLCTDYAEGRSCGKCMACRITQEGSNPDLQIIDPDGGSISVDEIRGIQSDIIIKPMYSLRKVYIIADAERMTVQAQNCLLKTLEEPPSYAVIILTTSNYEALLETIRSRTVRCSFKRNSDDEVRAYLGSRFGDKLDGMDFIVSYSGGVIGTALELAGSSEFISLREKTLDIVLKIGNSELIDIFNFYSFFDANKNNIEIILDIMLLFYRDLLIVKNATARNILINSDKKDIILNNISRFSVQRLLKNVDVIGLTRRNIKQNSNFQLSIEVMLMKLQEEGC